MRVPRRPEADRGGVAFIGKVLLALGAALALGTGALAEPLEGDFARDSSIVLMEEAGSGIYRQRTIDISMREGAATLRVITDGNVVEKQIPAQESIDLWNFLLAERVGELGDAQPSQLFPDASTFTLTCRVESSEHRFTVLDANRVEDARYRNILGRILGLADQHGKESD